MFSFFENVERVGSADYRPTGQDMLHARAATTGAVEINFVRDAMRFRCVNYCS